MKLYSYTKSFFGTVVKIVLIPVALALLFTAVYLSTYLIDWRIGAAALSLSLAILVFMIGWCLPKGARKVVARAGGCVAIAAAIAICSVIGVVVYEDAVTIHDTISGSVKKQSLPFRESSDIARLSETASERFSADEAPAILTDSKTYPLVSAFVNAVYEETESTSYGEFSYLAYDRAPSSVLEGTYDVLISARRTAENAPEKEGAEDFSCTVIGRYAVAVYTHKDVGVTDLTREELADILTGRVTNWKEVGGKDLEIKLYTHHDITTPGDLLEEYIGEVLADGVLHTEFVPNHFRFVQSVTEFRNVPGAIGFTLTIQIDEQYDDVQFLTIDGVEASDENIRDGSYPVTEDIVAATRPECSENVTRLIDWILSDEGQMLVKESGYVPVTAI